MLSGPAMRHCPSGHSGHTNRLKQRDSSMAISDISLGSQAARLKCAPSRTKGSSGPLAGWVVGGLPGKWDWSQGQIRAASASPHRPRFLQNKDKAPLCGTQAACSQQQRRAAFPLKNVTSPPFHQPPDSLKSERVGGAEKPQPLKRL